MGSLTNFPIDQVDSIGVDIEVNNLSDEHFRDVMEELTNHQIPERDKCPLVRRLNASISGYFKSTGDVGFSKMGPVKTNNNNNNNSTTNSKPGSSSLAGDLSGGSSGNNNVINSSNQGVDNGNSIELIEYRRTFEYKNYHSPKSCSNPSDIKIKSSERTKGSIGVHSSTTSATIHNHPSSSSSSTTSSSANTTISNSSSSPPFSSSSSNVTQNGSRVDSFVNFDSLKHPPCELTIEPSNEPTEGVCLNDNNPTPPALNTSNLSNNNTTNHLNTINSNTIINIITNDNLNNCNKDVNKDTNSKDTTNNKEGKDNSNNTNQATTTANNDTNNNTKGNRNGKEKKKKGKDKNLYKTVYTAQDIDGHIGDKPIEDLVYYVTGNKGEIVATAAAAAAAAGGGLTVATITANVNSGAGGLVTSSNLTTTTSTNLITGVNNPGPITVSASGIGVTPASSVLIGVNNNNNNGASVQCGSYCDNKLATISKSNKESGNVGGKVKKKEKPSPISSTSVAVSATPSSSSSSSSSLVVVNNSTNIQGRSKKGSNNNNNNQSSISTNNINLDNTSHATSNSSNSVYCASTNGIALISDTNVKKFAVEKTNNNNCSVNSGLGKSIPRSSSATTFDSKFSPASSSLSSSNVAQSEVNSSSSMDASSSTSPSLSKSHSIESSSSSLTVTSMQHQPHQPVTKLNTDPGITVSKSKVKDVHSTTTTNSNVNNNNKNSNVVNNNNNHCEGLRSNKKSYTSASSTHVATTANRDLENNNNNENNNFKELRYTASDPETVDQESFQPVKSKHLKRRKGVSRNKTVSVSDGGGDLRMSSPSPRSSNTIFTTSNSSSSTSTIPSSVTSSTSNSVNISMTARGYESEKEYCADEYRRRKEYLNHRKLASSMPHSEQNSADNSDMESSCSYPVSGRMPILPTPPVPPASSNNSISSTPKVSYADIAKMGSVIAVTPSVIVAGIGTGTGTSGSNVINKGPSPTNITLNSNSVKDANNNISTTGSTETSPKNASTIDSGLSLQTNLSPSTSCSPYPSSSPNCISPSGFSPSLSSSSSTTSNQTTTNTVTLLPEGSLKASSSKNPTNAIAYNQINKSSSSSPPHSSSESTIDATNLSKDNPPTIKSEINFDQEISSKDGKTIGNITISNQINSAAVAIRPKDFDTPKETKMENREVIYEDYPANNNNKINKNDKKMEKTIIQFTSPSPSPSSFSSSSSPTTSTTTSTTIPTSTTGVTIVGKTASTAKSSSTSATINSKTLEALLSPPVEKTPTSDMKNINKLSDTRVASIKSDTSSRASMLKKSNSIPGANVKINTINSTYRVNLNESINTNRSKLPISLPPVIMNDDSDGADESESLFTFGFFDDVTSSLKNSSSLNFNIKPMSSASTKITSTTTTTITKSTPSTISTATSPSASSSTIKSSNSMVVMTNRSSNSTSSSKTPTTVKNNYDNMKINATTSNNANSSVSRVKSTKNASKTNLTHSSATSSSSSTTNATTATIAPPPSPIKTANTVHNSVITSTGSTWPSLETVTELPHGKKNSGKDSKSTSGNGNNNPSLEKFIATKLAEPSTNMDADINTFNYSQTINFIKTAWESVMCQYHRSPDKNNSQTSSSSSTATPATASSSSTKEADLFCESTIYYKCEICEN